MNIVFSVTYYMESHNAITIYYRFHIFTNIAQIGYLDIIAHQHLYLEKIYI